MSQPLSWGRGYPPAAPPAPFPRDAQPVFHRGYALVRQASSSGCSALRCCTHPSSPAPASAQDPHAAMLNEATIPKVTPSLAKFCFLELERSLSERLMSARCPTFVQHQYNPAPAGTRFGPRHLRLSPELQAVPTGDIPCPRVSPLCTLGYTEVLAQRDPASSSTLRSCGDRDRTESPPVQHPWGCSWMQHVNPAPRAALLCLFSDKYF